MIGDVEDYPDVDQRSCRLLGPTALIVQFLMGIVVALSLVYKRHREVRKRPWNIWGFDVSKQVAGQMFVHGINLLVSDVVANHAYGNPCALYFLNVLVDTTLGVGVIYCVHHGLTYLLSFTMQFKGFESGQYGEPPSITYWFRQTMVYVFALTTMKGLVVCIFVIWPEFVKLGDWLLAWTGGGDSVQVIFVMGVFPIIMNVLQFWLIDSIVKAQNFGTIPIITVEDSDEHEPLYDGPNDDDANGHGITITTSRDIEENTSLESSSAKLSSSGNEGQSGGTKHKDA